MAAEELVYLSLKCLSPWRQAISSHVETWPTWFSSVGGSLWHISWLAYLCSSLSLVYHTVGWPICRSLSINISDQISVSLFFMLSHTLQANFAGGCRATSCGHSASQSMRYSFHFTWCFGLFFSVFVLQHSKKKVRCALNLEVSSYSLTELWWWSGGLAFPEE